MTADTRSDDELVAAWVEGERRAFDALVDRYERRVYGICYRYFGNASDAEDAMQETFVAVLRRGGTYSGTAAFSTWLYRVATNACNDLARKRSRRPRTVPLVGGSRDGDAPDGHDPRVDLPAVEDLLANRELGLELAAALRGIDAEHREAVVLHDVYGVPYHEIAARCGVAVGTVKSRIHRAHARLAAALSHLDDTSRGGSPPPPGEPSTRAQPPTSTP
ncbi:MAG TPA: RNA polymerase sigma factor [Egibacteraceae bacterium]|nr:RNA polymerase sigma factor [Egibacteraceae bacterium]